MVQQSVVLVLTPSNPYYRVVRSLQDSRGVRPGVVVTCKAAAGLQ
jgi:hypothetical protein